MTTRGRKAGNWTGKLEGLLRGLRKSSEPTTPIPPTRELAGPLGVTFTSVFRRLQRLEEEGLLWQAPNGRFYFPEAKGLIGRQLPVACLFRKMENWSLLYQELMEGIAQACVAQGLPSLLWHDDNLVRHEKKSLPPDFATRQEQIASLDLFLRRCGRDVGGVILDHIWCDEAISHLHEGWPGKAVRLCRPGPKGSPAPCPDFRGAAQLALSHLFARGYEKILPIRPFSNDPSIELSLDHLAAAAADSGAAGALDPVRLADTSASRSRLLRQLRGSRHRIALAIPEDNIAKLIWDECRNAGMDCPESLGILALQGTRAAEGTGLTHIRTDYKMIGQIAVEICLAGSSASNLSSPRLVQGDSTRAVS